LKAIVYQSLFGQRRFDVVAAKLQKHGTQAAHSMQVDFGVSALDLIG